MQVSVVMASYNGKKYICEQMESIRQQSRKITECIIVDDHSADGTDIFIENYIIQNHLSGWRLIRNETNQGYVRTFKKALSETSGDIIFFADQDDIWEKNKVEIMAGAMEGNSEILALCSGFFGIDKDSNSISVRRPILTENHGLIMLRKMVKNRIYKISLSEILSRNISMGCTMAIKRQLADIYLSNSQNDKIPHDWEMNFWAAINNGLFFLNSELIGYRIHDANTIGIKADDRIERGYRLHEYGQYVNCFHEFMSLAESGSIDKGKKDKIIRKLRCLISYYGDRMTALQRRSKVKTIVLIPKYFPVLGPEAFLAVMDVFSMRAECW